MHAPNPDLAGSSRLVDTWQLPGGARGTISYEWMEGGFCDTPTLAAGEALEPDSV
jgi:hypothetical protein